MKRRRFRPEIDKPLMIRAHALVLRAVIGGKLPRPESLCCVDCGAQARHYDHRDYSKPLDVQAVCASCNANRGPGLPYARAQRAKVKLTSYCLDGFPQGQKTLTDADSLLSYAEKLAQ